MLLLVTYPRKHASISSHMIWARLVDRKGQFIRILGKVALGIVYDDTHCYNLEKKCVPPY